jgi:hypothetical protein
VALNGPLILRDAQGKLLTDTGNPVGFNGGTPVTIDRKLTITDTGGPWKVAGLEYDIATRLAESIIGPAINWIAGVPLNAEGEVWAENAPVLFYAPNAIPITASGAVAMSVGLPPGGIPLDLADSVTTADNFTFILSTSRLITDDVFTVDAIGFAVSANGLSDTASPTDIIAGLVTKVLSDTTTSTDAINQSVNKSLADTTTSIDFFSQTFNGGLTDSVTSTDNIVISIVISAILTDNVTTIDNVGVSGGTTQAVADSINATDSINVVLSQALGDSASAIDSIAISPLKALADSASSTDNITLGLGFSQNLADSTTSTDNITTSPLKVLVDSVSSIDNIAITPNQNLVDSANSIDGITIALDKALFDTISSVDNVTAPLSVNRAITDNAVTTDNVTPVLSSGVNPATLFAAGELGAWYDPSDLSTLWQDTAGTTPVTTVGQSIARIDDKSGRGNNATQSVAGSRATLGQDGGGRYYIQFDGTDDSYVSPTINFTTGLVPSVVVWCGMYRPVNTPAAAVVEITVSSATTNQNFYLQSPGGITSEQIFWRSKGTVNQQVTATTRPTPDTCVACGHGQIASDVCRLRVNGVEVGTSGADQGTGYYANSPLYIGRRNNSVNPFPGRIYGLIIRGTTVAQGTTSPQTVIDFEQWMAGKTGISF